MSLFKLFTNDFDKSKACQLPLIISAGGNSKRVYWLSEDLESDPEHVERVRALTLNKEKPLLGLKGTFGLFASPEWWANINNRNMPLFFISGTIVRVYEAGQDRCGKLNTIDIETSHGETVMAGIYANNKSNLPLFRKGVHIEIVYAQDELKSPDCNGAKAYSKTPLEVVISIPAEA